MKMPWWKWMKIGGTIGLVGLLVALLCGVSVPRLVMAIIIHLALDFTLQSPDTSAKKGERSSILVAHAWAAGVLPLALAAKTPEQVMPWGIAGFLAHYMIDYTQKFGLKDPWGPLADQVAHWVVLFAITEIG